MALELIKISEFPESLDLKDWFVVGDIDGISYKISRANLEAELGISSLLQMGGAIIPTSTPEPAGDYFWIATEAGTYTNFGGIIVPANSIAIISRVGGVFSSSITQIEPQDLSGLSTKEEVIHLSGNYSFVNINKGNIFVESNKIIFDKNPLLFNAETDHRVYLFPQNTVFPTAVDIPNSTLIGVSKTLFDSTQVTGWLPSDALVQIPYGNSTEGYIPIFGKVLGDYGFGDLGENITNSQIDILATEKVTGYTFEQGSINSDGVPTNSTIRIRTSFIEMESVEFIVLPAGYKCIIAYFDQYKVFIQSDITFRSTFKYGKTVKKARYVRIVIARNNETAILPETVGEGIYINPYNVDKQSVGITRVQSDFEWEQGTLSFDGGNPTPSNTRIRSGFIPTDTIENIKVNPANRFTLYLFDKDKVFLSATSFIATISDVEVNGFIRLALKYTDDSPITVTDETGLTIVYSPKYAPYGTSGIPDGGTEGDVLTPTGWSGDFLNSADTETLINEKVALETFDVVRTYSLNTTLADYIKSTDQVEFLKDSTVSPAKLSQSTLDLINASGGGTITNLADDVDIVSTGGSLKLKDSEVVRFRVKATPQENFNELARCKATGFAILFKDVVDLANTDGSIRIVDLSTTLIFRGNGRIKNCLIRGTIGIDAYRKRIFENVFFHTFKVNAVSQINKNSIFNAYPPNLNLDIYDHYTKELKASSLTEPYNPFRCSMTLRKIGDFQTPVLEGANYVYKEGSQTLLTFVNVGGKIRVPIRKDFVFTDQTGNVLESNINLRTFAKTYVEIEPENLRVSRLYPPILVLAGFISNEVCPEWFGASYNDSAFDNKEALQAVCLLAGTINFASFVTYWTSGGIMLYSNSLFRGNKSTVRMMSGSSEKCLFEIETRYLQDGITIYDLRITGAKGNLTVQDGIYADPQRGIVDGIQGYSFNNTYWYNLEITNFSGSGINCAVPGTSHIYSSYVAFNKIDGIAWWLEHFTLINCTSWTNDRHGVFTGGNHWRIIGGAYAHNGAGSNIHCIGATVSQIIGCSVIHSGVFLPKTGGGYAASSLNVYGFIWVGEGLGTHEMIGGDGVYLENCKNMTFESVRVSGSNANSYNVLGTSEKITISNGIFEGHNLVRKDFKNINGSAKDKVRVSNTEIEGQFVMSNSNELLFFGDANSQANWDNLKGTFTEFKSGVFHVRDSYDALGRPTGITGDLAGTIRIMPVDSTSMRCFLELYSQEGKLFTRFFNIAVSSGVYSNDTGWVEK